MKRREIKINVPIMAFVVSVVVIMTLVVSITVYWLTSPCANSNKLDLHITRENNGFGGVQLNAALKNNDNRTVRLVLPGDGSESGWRTPIIKWKIQELNTGRIYFASKFPGCGNINALKWGEVFHLSPNETRDFTRHFFDPILFQPGDYKISLVYINKPTLAWGGVPLGFHNSIEMLFVRYSTECEVTSNEIIISVAK